MGEQVVTAGGGFKGWEDRLMARVRLPYWLGPGPRPLWHKLLDGLQFAAVVGVSLGVVFGAPMLARRWAPEAEGAMWVALAVIGLYGVAFWRFVLALDRANAADPGGPKPLEPRTPLAEPLWPRREVWVEGTLLHELAPIEVYESKSELGSVLLWGGALTLGFLVMGAICVFRAGEIGEGFLFLGCGLFGVSLLVLELFKLSNKAPVLRLGEDGITLRDYGCVLPYRSLDHAAVQITPQNNTILAIHPRDEGDALRQASLFGRVNAWFNRSARLPSICLSAKGLSPSPYRVESELNHRIALAKGGGRPSASAR